MTCSGCSGAVTRVLSKTPAVESFTVDLEAQKVTVVSSSLLPEEVVELVAKTGKTTSLWA